MTHKEHGFQPPEVETTQRNTAEASASESVVLPRSRLFDEVEALNTRVLDLERSINERVATITQEIKSALREASGVHAMSQELSELLDVANAEQRALHVQFIDEAYTGKYGRGKLHLVDGAFCRLLPLANNNNQLRTSVLTKETFHREDFATHVLVDMELTTEEDYLTWFNERRQKVSGDLLSLLPAFVTDTIATGEVFSYGGCSHHSGCIEGYLMKLPSGRFALIKEYSGYRSPDGNRTALGAFEMQQIPKSDWSARSSEWRGSDYEAFTPEETEFLQTQDTFYNLEIEEEA